MEMLVQTVQFLQIVVMVDLEEVVVLLVKLSQMLEHLGQTALQAEHITVLIPK